MLLVIYQETPVNTSFIISKVHIEFVISFMMIVTFIVFVLPFLQGWVHWFDLDNHTFMKERIFMSQSDD